jgi:hypothetical protein
VTELDFDIIREPWNKYELSDGTILKIKLVLLRVVKKEKTVSDAETGKTKTAISYGFESQNILTVYNVPDHLKSQPSREKYPPEVLRENVVESDMRYSTLEEEWNEYILEDRTRLRIKLTVVKVDRTKKVDHHGFPIYLVESPVLPQFKTPPRK